MFRKIQLLVLDLRIWFVGWRLHQTTWRAKVLEHKLDYLKEKRSMLREHFGL